MITAEMIDDVVTVNRQSYLSLINDEADRPLLKVVRSCFPCCPNLQHLIKIMTIKNQADCQIPNPSMPLLTNLSLRTTLPLSRLSRGA
jgi:hypothetical protein